MANAAGNDATRPLVGPTIDPEYHVNCERRARLAEAELVTLRATHAAVEAALGDFPVDLRPIDPEDAPLVDEATWRLREACRAVAGAREALGMPASSPAGSPTP